MLLFSFLSYRDFQQTIGEQSRVWNFARTGWQNGQWRPLVTANTPGSPAAGYKYNGNEAIDPNSGATTLAGFQSKLRDISSRDIPIGFVFKPLAHFFHLEGDRKLAQRVVFEGGVVKPLVDSDRARMLVTTDAKPVGKNADEAARHEAEGVAMLIRVEADALKPGTAEGAPNAVLHPGINYSTGATPAALDKTFPTVSDDFLWTYTKNPAGSWPPKWLPQGSGSLEANKPIKAGLDRMFADASTGLQSQQSSLDTIKGLRDDLREFRDREAKLNDLAKTDDRHDLDAKMDGRLKELQATKVSIDAKVKAAKANGLLKENSVSKEYRDLVEASKSQSEAAFKVVRDAATNTGAKPDARLFPEVVALLDKKHDDMVAQISGSFSKDEITELADLDPLLGDFGDGRRNYEVRLTQYQNAEGEMNRVEGEGSLLGRDWSPLVEAKEQLDKTRSEARNTQEKLGGKFDAAAYFYDRALERRTLAISTRYLAQTRQPLQRPILLSAGPHERRSPDEPRTDRRGDDRPRHLAAGPQIRQHEVGAARYRRPKLKAFASDHRKARGQRRRDGRERHHRTGLLPRLAGQDRVGPAAQDRRGRRRARHQHHQRHGNLLGQHLRRHAPGVPRLQQRLAADLHGGRQRLRSRPAHARQRQAEGDGARRGSAGVHLGQVRPSGAGHELASCQAENPRRPGLTATRSSASTSSLLPLRFTYALLARRTPGESHRRSSRRSPRRIRQASRLGRPR